MLGLLTISSTNSGLFTKAELDDWEQTVAPELCPELWGIPTQEQVKRVRVIKKAIVEDDAWVGATTLTTTSGVLATTVITQPHTGTTMVSGFYNMVNLTGVQSGLFGAKIKP